MDNPLALKAARYAADEILKLSSDVPTLTVADALKVQIALRDAYRKGCNAGIDHFSDCTLAK